MNVDHVPLKCAAGELSLVPVPGRDNMVGARPWVRSFTESFKENKCHNCANQS